MEIFIVLTNLCNKTNLFPSCTV